MKKIIVSAAAILFAVTVINAQASDIALRKDIKDFKQEETSIKKDKKEQKRELRKLEGQEASYQSKQQFYIDFGNLPVSEWKRTDYFDEATFVMDGEKMKAYYDMDSQLVGTTSDKSFDDLPAAAQKYIDTKYSDYSKGPVIFFDDNEANDMDMVMYGTRVDDSDMYFIELSKDNKQIILKVEMDGNVSFFTQLS
jgi:hypothetical protein